MWEGELTHIARPTVKRRPWWQVVSKPSACRLLYSHIRATGPGAQPLRLPSSSKAYTGPASLGDKQHTGALA